MEPSWSWSMTRFSRSLRRKLTSSSMTWSRRVGLRSDGAAAGRAAERAHPAGDYLRLLASQQLDVGLQRDQSLAADDDLAWLREVERHHLDVLESRCSARCRIRSNWRAGIRGSISPGFTRAVEVVPQLRSLVAWLPTALFVAEAEDALLGAGLFFVAAARRRWLRRIRLPSARRPRRGSATDGSTALSPGRMDCAPASMAAWLV